MLIAISISYLLVLSVAARSVPLDKAQQRPESRIQWSPCPADLSAYDAHNRTLQCGTLAVPLDYSVPSSNLTLNLDIIKIPALKEPKKGSIFFNWGGPGADGRYNMAIMSPTIQP
jgi:hypothetical protein